MGNHFAETIAAFDPRELSPRKNAFAREILRRRREAKNEGILRLVPGVGHMIHYAVPEEVAEAIEGRSDDARLARLGSL